MVHNYGMAKAKVRTTFALDEQTISKLRTLARRWNVSQAEVVRRAVRAAAEQDDDGAGALRERLVAYHAAGRLNADDVDTYLSEASRDRHNWRHSS